MLPKEGIDVVISGVGGKFPDTDNIADLQEKLFAKQDLFTEPTRWQPGCFNSPKAAGQILKEYKYDAHFFGVYRKLCTTAEPMMKLTMERCYEALFDAGINPFTLKNRNIAVIVCTVNSESEIICLTHNSLSKSGGNGIQGQSQALIANRISYFFNFTGPSVTMNFSNTGGIFAIEHAATLIRQGAISAALVATPYIMWYPTVYKEYTDLNMLTFQNKCHPFDDNADGLIRSDGVVAYFLQRKEEANRIYANIIDVDTKCLGSRDCSFIKFDSRLQQFLTNFYKNTKCDTKNIGYVEPEGLAVKDLDAAELNSLANVLLTGRKSPLLIGSVKSNLGHAHVCASFMAMAKAIIAMETGRIPPTLYYKTPNSNVPALVNGSLKVVTEETPFDGDLVAVNNLTFSGTVGHILLRRHDKAKLRQTTADSEGLPADGLPRLVLFSARHEEGALAVSQKIKSMPLDTEFISLVNNIHKFVIPNHLYRSYAVLPNTLSKEDIAFNDSHEQRPLWFLFSGMGSQWKQMGKDLLKLPVFAAAIKKCDEVLKPKGVDIVKILTIDDDSVFENIINSFVGITAVQIGLLDILSAVGVKPDGIIGHSAGELGCAYADGCLTIQETVLSAWARGKATVDGTLIKGLMVAVGLGFKEVQSFLPPTVDVACHNSSNGCTISGPHDDVLQVMNSLKEKNIFVKAVSTGERSYHSRYISPITGNLRQMLEKIIPEPRARSPRWVCTSVPKEDWETEDAKFASPAYYTNNMINPVLFEEGCAFIPADAVIIEIAPYGLMQAVLRRTLNEKVISLTLTSKTAKSNLVHLLCTLGKLHNSGIDLDVNALYPRVNYPVSRGTPSLTPLITWDHTDTWFTQFIKVLALTAREVSEKTVMINNTCDEYKLWSEHSVNNETVVPLSQLLLYPWYVILKTKDLNFEEQAVEITDVVVTCQVLVNANNQEIAVAVFHQSENFEVSLCIEKNNLKPVVSGKISIVKRPELDVVPVPQRNDHPGSRVTRLEFYSVLAQHNYHLGPQFQVLNSLFITGRDLRAVVTWTGELTIFVDALFKLLVFMNCECKSQIVEPISFRKLVIDSPYFHSLPKGTQLDVCYKFTTNILSCKGLYLEGLTVSSHSLRQMDSSSLVWKYVKFVPYTKNINMLDEFLRISVQLVAEEGLNSWSNNVASFVTLETRKDPNKPFIAHSVLQDLLKSMPNVSTRIQVSEIQKVSQDLMHAQQKTCLVMGDYKLLHSLIDISQDQRNIFFLTFLPNREQLVDNLQQILSHQLRDGALVLLKRWSDPGKLRVFQLDWMAGLRQFMSHNKSGQPVIVVSRHWQPRQALKTLALESYAHQLRCVFLDKQAPQFSITSPLFHRQLTLGLSVNMLSGRTWGSYRTGDLPDVTPDSNHLSKLESSVKSLQVSCIALNTRNFTFQPEVPSEQVKMKYLDYCGIRCNKERVMGVGTYDKKSEQIVPDQTLVWPVPSQWSLESAVTVPFSYALAYYSLLLKAKLEKGESVLVHAGQSPIGQAAISVSLERGANVLVTVCTDDQSDKLLSLFPQINAKNIIVTERSSFEFELKKLTKNHGVQVVLSCLKGTDINASLRLVSRYARMVHLGDICVQNKEKIGMFPFSKSCSFFVVSLDNLINNTVEEKVKLKALVENGMKHGVVKPLKSSQFSALKAADALHNFQFTNSEEKTVLLKPEQLHGASYKCDPNDSFIIIGTNHGLWLSLAKWLLRNGARKLIIASLKHHLSTNVSRKFNSFMSQHSATIVMTTINRLDSNKGAEEFLLEAVKMGPVGGIFCTFMEEKSAQMSHLDAASRLVLPQLKQFVCLLGGSASVCQSRAELNLSSCLVLSESPLHKPHDILPYLSTVLAKASTAHTFLVSDYSSIYNQRGTKTSFQDLKHLLPSTMTEMETLGEIFKSSTPGELQECVTRSPGYQVVRFQLLPVFLIPGLDSTRLDPLIKQLIHPAFCPRLAPCLGTVEESAQLLVKKLLHIQSKGPYNIVGETWSGAVALRMATMLDCQGHQVSLFLLDAAPQTLRLWTKAFCDHLEEFSNTKFLMALLNLPANVSRPLSDLKSWAEQLQFSLQYIQLSPEAQSNTSELTSAHERIGTTLTALRNHLMAVLQFQQPQHLFSGNIHLFKTCDAVNSDYCDLQKFCKNTPTVHKMEDETLEEMMKNPKTAEAINRDLAFTWDL